MSTARTTPAQNPRGLTLSNTFPFVSVCIVILMSGFRRLYHTSRTGRLAAFPAVWTTTMFLVEHGSIGARDCEGARVGPGPQPWHANSHIVGASGETLS